MRPEEVVVGTLLSEKAMRISEGGAAYALKVHLRSTKDDIRKALKALFDVDALEVNTAISRGKVRRRARSKDSAPVMVKSPNIKKAYVVLKKGQELPTPVLAAEPESKETV